MDAILSSATSESPETIPRIAVVRRQREIVAMLALALFIILPVSLPIAAQTSGELRQRYRLTSAVESFEVRLGIIATIFYGENGQAVEVLIRHRLSSSRASARDEMPYKMFAEILDEFAPEAQRGRLCSEPDGFQSGRNHYVTATYENVSIYSVLHNPELDSATASMAQITWEKTDCPVEAGDNGAPK
jgi:hypothetical protein